MGPAGPRSAVTQTVVVRPQMAEDAAREVESHGPALVTRPQDRHGFACPMCKGMRVGSVVLGDAIKVRCQDCRQEFPDMLALIPLERVGALEIAFGAGWRQIAGPAAIVAGLAGVYVLLKLLR